MAKELNIQHLQVFGDSQLVISQVTGKYQTLKPELSRYCEKVLELAKQIPVIHFTKITRAMNSRADALARIAKELSEPNGSEIQVVIHGRRPLSNSIETQAEVYHITEAQEDEDWRQPFIKYFQDGTLPEDKAQRAQIKIRSLQYTFVNNTLYRKTYEQMWLRCVSNTEAKQIMNEVHTGICGAHQSGPKMHLRIKRMGYYWPTMVSDCEKMARDCHMCQVHGPFIHRHPNPLHPTIASWPFDIWGADVIGPIDPPASNGDKFILAFTDYFTKWAEAASYREVKASAVVKFIKHHILFRFGTPRRIISDNGASFQNEKVWALSKKFNIDWRYSSIYNPRANGLAIKPS